MERCVRKSYCIGHLRDVNGNDSALLLCSGPQKLEKALRSSLRSDLEDVSLALLMSPAHFDAYLLRKATKVRGCSFQATLSRTILSIPLFSCGYKLFLQIAEEKIDLMHCQMKYEQGCTSSVLGSWIQILPYHRGVSYQVENACLPVGSKTNSPSSMISSQSKILIWRG